MIFLLTVSTLSGNLVYTAQHFETPSTKNVEFFPLIKKIFQQTLNIFSTGMTEVYYIHVILRGKKR